MSRLTTYDRRATGTRLRAGGRRSCKQEQRPGVATRPDPRFLRYLAEHRALPVDLAAALLRCSKQDVKRMIRAGSELGWIRSFEYPGEPGPWAGLTRRGWVRAGRPPRENWRPSPVSLPHRREVIKARLMLRDEKPGWAWLSETDVAGQNSAGAFNPDGVLKRGNLRWAIEVERSKKLVGTLRTKLEALCSEYARVIYFAPPSIRATLKRLQEAGELENLEVRPLPGEPVSTPRKKFVRWHYEPSVAAREMLVRINEEGVVARAQLARFLGWDEPKVEETLRELDESHCLRRRGEKDKDRGWIWCSRRGVNRSGSDLAPPPPPNGGGLVKRFVLMEVRLDLLAQFPGSKWVTRRRLSSGCKGNLAAAPDAVLVRGGKRYAVVVFDTRRSRPAVVQRLNRWKSEYAGVICYRSRHVSNWVTGLVCAYELDWLDVRDLPVPPEGSPYRSLEEESPTANREGGVRVVRQLMEPATGFVPDEVDRAVLLLASSEASVSQLQLPRAVGCTRLKAEESVERLKDHAFVVVEDGWIRSTTRGTDASGLGFRVARPRRNSRYLEEVFHVMEIRLSLDQPASLERWKTRRQLTMEAGVDPGSVTGFPHGVALIDGQWHAIGLFLTENRRREMAERLLRWRADFPRVRCYCMKGDVESFEAFVARWEVPAVEVMPIPESPEPVAREMQVAALNAILASRKNHAVEEAPKLAARHALCSAVRSGKVEKPDTCEVCKRRVGKSNVEALYLDYSRPLDVKWMCRRCHRTTERVGREAKARRDE